jgi:hypothetical protein
MARDQENRLFFRFFKLADEDSLLILGFLLNEAIFH